MMRIKRSVLLTVIGLLLVTNILTLIFSGKGEGKNTESVASIDGKDITREEWLHSLEDKYGKEELKVLINRKVMDRLALKYDISVSQKEIDREFAMIQSAYNVFDEGTLQDEKDIKSQIKADLLLEKLLTKDVEISDKELKKYYEQNERVYSIPKMLKLKQIQVPDQSEANQVLEELKDGSSFEALAMEKSTDQKTAPLGGDLGYIPEDGDILTEEAKAEVKTLSKGEWSKPVPADDGYLIYFVEDTIKKNHYSFKQVKEQIRRKIALEQVESPMRAESFWDELDVDWYYGEERTK